MAFTKITAAGIGSTETVTLDGLSVINNGSFGGNLTVSGVLTYEDVTNVDSVGLITARNGVVVGSGITLSKDGDVFFTGIATGNGSGLTALNASNLASGTVPTARLGSGTASSSTFLRGDSTFQTDNTDLVSDTSPQLGGALDTNDKSIAFGDSNNDATASGTLNRLKFGAGTDMVLYHNGTDNFIKNPNGNFKIFTSSDKQSLIAKPDGEVELYHNDNKKLETTSSGVTVTGTLAATAVTGDGSALTGVVAIPSGGIILWSGAANAIPSGFVLCDGNNGTPNLSGRFVVGYSASDSDFDVGDTGGAKTDSISISVSGTTGTPSSTAKAQFTNNINLFGTSTHTHSFSGSGSATVDTLPPYYALCYIMKT